MKKVITLLALAFSFSTSANLAPVFRCTGLVKSPEGFEVIKVEFKSGGAAINDHMYGETDKYIFLGFIGGNAVDTTAYQGTHMTMGIYLKANYEVLAEKKVVLYSNTLVQIVKAEVGEESASLSCARYR